MNSYQQMSSNDKINHYQESNVGEKDYEHAHLDIGTQLNPHSLHQPVPTMSSSNTISHYQNVVERDYEHPYQGLAKQNLLNPQSLHQPVSTVTPNETINHYQELNVVERDYEHAYQDLKKQNKDEIFYDNVVSISNVPSLQPMDINESDKKTGKFIQ